MTHAASGTTVSTSRRTRTVPHSVRRALEHRDRGCRFPGCDNRICDAHHIRHWADGGATTLHNLVLLCRRCHRRVHEDGYLIRHNENRGIVFLRPDGSELPSAPALPPVSAGFADQLRAAAQDHGIDADATLPHWTSRSLDLDFALRTLHR